MADDGDDDDDLSLLEDFILVRNSPEIKKSNLKNCAFSLRFWSPFIFALDKQHHFRFAVITMINFFITLIKTQTT